MPVSTLSINLPRGVLARHLVDKSDGYNNKIFAPQPLDTLRDY